MGLRHEARRVLDEARETAVRLTREVVAEIAHIRKVAVEASAPPPPAATPAPEVGDTPSVPAAAAPVGTAERVATPDEVDAPAVDERPAPPVPIDEPRPGFFRRLFWRA